MLLCSFQIATVPFLLQFANNGSNRKTWDVPNEKMDMVNIAFKHFNFKI